MPADTTHAHAHTCTDFTEREHKHVYRFYREGAESDLFLKIQNSIQNHGA